MMRKQGRFLFAGLAVCMLLFSPAHAQSPCDDHAWVHWYAVEHIDTVMEFFGSVEGYRVGRRTRVASPWAKGDTPPQHMSIDLCPLSADDRLVRLVGIPAGAADSMNILPGTLTLYTKDYSATFAAARSLLGAAPNTGSRDGRRSIWFDDAFGNTFIVWEVQGSAN